MCFAQKMHWGRNNKVKDVPEELDRFLTQDGESHHNFENLKPALST